MKVIFAGGGTGGHLMAGLSIAEEISSRFPDTSIVFFCINLKKEAGYLENSGYEIRQIRARKLASILHLPSFVFVSAVGIVCSLGYIVKMKPDFVVGLGGYGSVLPVIAAYMCSVPIVLIEQNSIPGRANRMLAKWVDIILCHWESTAKWFKKAKAISVTGIPVRKNIVKEKTETAYKTFGLSRQSKTLLIMGGSQGAQTINKVLLQCVPKIKKMVPELQIVHLAGKLGYNEVKRGYENMEVRAFVSDYFEDMGLVYGIADLIICRSGANTISEIAEAGVPAILIPYPYATDNHQYWNAYELAKNGGALIVKQEELNPEKMIELVVHLLKDYEKLHEMRTRNKKLSKPDSASSVLDVIMRMLMKKRHSQAIIPDGKGDRKENESYHTRLLS